MHSSLIGKIEKANRYARERDRITFDALSVTFRGDNDTHTVSLDADGWHCNCHYFETFHGCAHSLALQKILGEMLPEKAQTSLFERHEAVLTHA
jgi:hypothetical protein